MKGKTPKLVIDSKNAFLAALHVLFQVMPLVVHPPKKLALLWGAALNCESLQTGLTWF